MSQRNKNAKKDSSKLDQVNELERKRLKEVSKKIWEKQPHRRNIFIHEQNEKLKNILNGKNPKQALTTFKGLLNKGQLRDVPLDDIQRLAGKIKDRIGAIRIIEKMKSLDLINGFIEHGDIKGAGQLFVDMLREGLAAPNIFIPNNQNSDKQTESNNLLTWEKTLLEQIYIILTQTFVYHDNLHQAKKY
ncbi:hypothetical protein C2G38_2205812 [Gigaspora rosea]|uniref:Uncharacterized protein n=1 Tax=Gigaspora rosea TaxID=44941 RepID=A0A397UTN0_9GLOM|nr:hypothetical protein C2G38_2205812 [Gigaspora rosea]